MDWPRTGVNVLLGEGMTPPCAMDPGAGVSGCERGGVGILMCSEEPEDDAKPERSRGRAIKTPMTGVCRRHPEAGE